jgi:hypothetical protein
VVFAVPHRVRHVAPHIPAAWRVVASTATAAPSWPSARRAPWTTAASSTCSWTCPPGAGSLADASVHLSPGPDRDRTGSTLADGGDVDGDGLGDLLVNARFDDEGGENAGALFVVTGAWVFEG